jgi:hypothetical protein
MKSLIKALSFAAVFGFFATSCETDPCKDVVCGDHGTCLEGTCNCETGYEKDAQGLCNTEVRAKFVDSWTVADDCSVSGTASYTVSVTASTANILEVKITNFWGTFVNQAVANIDGNTISIARQQPDNDNYFIIGQGTINAAGNTITWTNYTITDETNPASIVTDACTATWTK